ncbi:hypothetical protein [Microvirga sp. TS319]|uniref:hypothetical protein n=1 Tax=Microvirga sp. TS319 TaxID=3241165 RepID=UPI00351A7DC2
MRTPFTDRAHELVANGPLKDAVEAVPAALQEVSPQIDILRRRLIALARQNQARLLMTARGVGALVDLSQQFVSEFYPILPGLRDGGLRVQGQTF